MNALPVIVSCEYRWRTRARTVASLVRHDVRPMLIRTHCRPARPIILRHAAKVAMNAALDRGQDLLFIEDDVIADDTLPTALALAATVEHPTVLCVLPDECQPPDIMRRIELGEPVPQTIRRLPGVDSFWGSQMVYVPRAAMPFLLSSPHLNHPGQHRLAFDTAIRNAYREVRLPIFGVFPNPVQHLNEPSARKVTRQEAPRRTRVSPTFGHRQA